MHINDFSVRQDLTPGDIGDIISIHGRLYNKEFGYSNAFEAYVAAGFSEYVLNYDPLMNRSWLFEYNNSIAGFILLMNRGPSAQLRFFFVQPEYRGIGVGNRLMELFMEFYRQCRYESSFLWTTSDLRNASHLYIKYGYSLAEEIDSNRFSKFIKEQKYVLSSDIY